MHRYLNPNWVIRRLEPYLDSVLSQKIIMDFLGSTGAFGPEKEVSFLEKLVPRDQHAIDVGAADGLYAWKLARICAGCIAFEANPQSAKKLEKRIPTITVHAISLSNFEGESLLRIPKNKNIIFSGHATVERANDLKGFDCTNRIRVPTRKLDSFDMPDIGFIKIDVEGH